MYKLTVILILILLSGCQSTFVKPSTTGELIELRQQATTAYHNKENEKALELYFRINQQVSNDPINWLRIGNIYARLQQPENAISAYEKTVTIDPSISQAWNNMGIVQLRLAANSFTHMLNHLEKNDPLYSRALRLSEGTLNLLNKKHVEATATKP